MKDEHTYGEKMARNGRTKVIYKGTFISNQSLGTQKMCFPLQPYAFFAFTSQLIFKN